MREQKKKRRGRKRRYRHMMAGVICGILLVCAAITVIILAVMKSARYNPEEFLQDYISCISQGEYKKMYEMIDVENSRFISEEDFIKRNSAIYEGIEATNIKVEVIDDVIDEQSIRYRMSFDTVAGNVSFENEMDFVKGKGGYKLKWDDSLIFPGLERSDKVRVSTSQAVRGEITDRNGRVLAGKGAASSVGIVPGKIENRDETFKQIAELLNIDTEVIEKKLEAKWVKEDSFVPIMTIPKVQELDLMRLEPDEEVLAEKERQEKLLRIPGVMLSDIEVRSYSLKEAAAHLIGYVQDVTAEDLENHQGEGYSANSVIGRTGMEGLFEKELKGRDGHDITIIDENGNTKEVVAQIIREDGKNIQLTIDAELQQLLYAGFKDDPGCSVAINPYTGEVLALVSTPAYDNNDFIEGLTTEQWTLLNEDEKKPMFNRFRQVWCPGSTFKPVIASIGLETGTLDPDEDFGNAGLSWQKDSSWGSYYVTTLHAYEPVVMKNAIIYSDNIYFAKAALKIGADNLEKSLDAIGFNQELPFEIVMSNSQYSNTEKIESEIQLADSGYGQGQVLVNPLHLACIYTALLNHGNMIKPYLQYKENPTGEVWIPEAFSENTVRQVLDATIGVVNDPDGTGYAAYREDIILAGKTGTAELKATKEDTSGTEIGWFSVFTTDPNTENPILIVSMVEDVKGIGGSGYVVNKDKEVLAQYIK